MAKNQGLLLTASEKKPPPSNNHMSKPSWKWILQPHSSPEVTAAPADISTAALLNILI